MRTFRLPGRQIAIGLICLWSLFPIYWALNTSLMTNDVAQSVPSHYAPLPPFFGNYGLLFGLRSDPNNPASDVWPQISRSLVNIFVECAASTIITVIIAVFSAVACRPIVQSPASAH